MRREESTLAVLVSPPGRGAVALIHVSGSRAREVVARVLEGGRLPPPGGLRHAWLVDGAGERLDDVLVVAEDAGTALAGLPLVELGVHGGPAVLDAVFGALVWAGARAGDWKELLGQAWRTGARDALFLAAHRWLGRAVSGTGVRILARALSGELQARVRAALEPTVDREELRALEAASRRAAVWFRPLRVILTGPPNAGKSTLFNALLGWDRATVSPQAGTTRDAVEEDLLLGDRPVRLVDTAGDRGGAGECGRPRRRHQVQVFLADGTVPGSAADDLARAGRPGEPSVRAVNKLDRLSGAARAELPAGWLPISARTGEGLETLVAAVFAAADGASGPAAAGSGPVLFTRRDLRLLAQGLGEGAAARRARRELLGRARPGRVSRAGGRGRFE